MTRVPGTLTIVTIIAIAVVACGLLPPTRLFGGWQLESGTLDGRAIPAAGVRPVILRVYQDHVGGRAQCNQYGGALSLEGGEFKVTGVGGTAIGCGPDVDASEAAYLTALGRIDRANVDGRALILSGPGAELRYVAVSPPPMSEVTGSDWTLTRYSSDDAWRVPEGEHARVRLEGDGSFTASTGCRAVTGMYVVSGDEIVVTSASSDGDCPARLQDQDAQVIGVLVGSYSIEVDNGRLILSSTRTTGILEYERVGSP